MKNLRSLLALISLITILNSCVDDNAADPNIPGSDRDKFVGSWLCKETVTGSAPNTFTITIQKYGNDDTLRVYNFNNLGAQDYAVWLVSGNSVTIPNQTITQIDIAGSGFYSNDKIALNYSSDADQITATCTQ
ncbi:MAG TPA: hypothetical protein PKD91_07945 [Bacteroidia bacterium]|nr:hypothetical protein [Bacteroidia bacterium]